VTAFAFPNRNRVNTNVQKLAGTDATSELPTTDRVVQECAAPREEKFDFWNAAHRALRGRYRLAVLLAAGGAVVGAAVGGMVGQRLYSATGLIRIASVLPHVMRETDQNRPMAMFDGFIQAQRDLMLSREMIQTALEDPAWLEPHLASKTPSDQMFAASLKVESRPRSDHLRVTYSHKDPIVATTAVRSIIATYQQAFVREQDRVEGQRTGQLTARRDTLTAALEQLETEIAPIAEGRTAAELEPLYLAAADRVKKLRASLADAQSALAGGPDGAPRQAGRERRPGELAADEILRSYAVNEARARGELERARARGLLPAHPLVMQLEAAAKECRQRVEEYALAYETWRSERTAGPTPMSLAEREANLKHLTQIAEAEMARLSDQRVKLSSFELQAAALQKNLLETESRLDALATEASFGSRLTIISSGEKPLTALLDNRAKLGAAGALAGIALPIGLLILRGTHRRRYRFADEVAADLTGRVPFVAVLPGLAVAPNAPAGTLGMAAARSIHDLRVRLQPVTPGSSRTYLITSTAAGEGKTVLTVALGISFAAAGFRTLVVDCDLSSRQLSRGFSAESVPGMIESMNGGEPFIQRIRTGLFVLAAGACAPQDVYRCAPAATAQVLATVRPCFDVILIDGDPILTGITASVIASQADGVIVTVARGQEESTLRSALRQIGARGAAFAAAVFNNAPASDLRSASNDLPTEGLQHSGTDKPQERVLAARLHRFGPVVAATLASLSLTREDDLDLVPAGLSLARTDRTPTQRIAA